VTFTDLRADPESDPLTAGEIKAITSLERLAKHWPQSLTLFSKAGSLTVIRTGTSLLDSPRDDVVITVIDGIPNDGGDP
jgi:hypothetical protein